MELIETKGNELVRETDDYIIYKNKDGLFTKEMKYHSSLINMESVDPVELYNVMNGSSNKVVEMKAAIGTNILIKGFFTSAFESFDEKTGETSRGVTSTIYDGQNYFATSSKSVYYDLMNLNKTFGITVAGVEVKVVGTKQQRGTQIRLELIKVNK